MLRALPVVKISAREPDMAGTASAGRGEIPSGESTRRTRGSASSKSSGSSKSSASPKRRRTSGSPATDEAAGRLPVRVGEERWTADELAKVRSGLSEENDDLQAEITRAESQIADRLGDTGEGA